MGPPAQIVQAVLQHRVVPVMSTATFAELKSVVRRPKLQPAFARAGVDIENFLTTVRTETQFVQPISTSVRIRDERDRPFLDVMAPFLHHCTSLRATKILRLRTIAMCPSFQRWRLFGC